MSYRIALALICLTILLVGIGYDIKQGFQANPKNKDAPKNYNVILISIDTFRADHLSCYGYPLDITPNICDFARDGILFSSCIAQAPSTLPSHASIFTSMIPSHHKASIRRKQKIAPEIKTLTEVLKDEGYSTVAFTGGGQIAGEIFNQGFDLYYDDGGGSERVFNISLEWLRMNKNERFFLFIHTYEIHTPYSPDLEFARAIENDYNGTLPRTITKKLLQSINRKKRVSNEDKRHIVAMYDANIMEMDADFWDFMDSLKRLGLYNDTIIVFTSDHGEEFGEHGMMGWHSHTLYNELLKIPLIIKLPADNAKGKVINELVRSIDIAPTILDILKIKAPPYYEGDSLMPLINENRWGIEYAVSEKESYRCGNSIQNLEWKYYCDKLYRLPLDPKERQSSKDNFPGEYYHLTEVMERWVKFSVPNKTVAYIPLQNVTIEKFYTQENQANASGKLGNKTLEQLRSLGYLS